MLDTLQSSVQVIYKGEDITVDYAHYAHNAHCALKFPERVLVSKVGGLLDQGCQKEGFVVKNRR
jgi:hypothetical protein